MGIYFILCVIIQYYFVLTFEFVQLWTLKALTVAPLSLPYHNVCGFVCLFVLPVSYFLAPQDVKTSLS